MAASLSAGDIVTQSVSFSGHEWPLPPGQWQVAANLPSYSAGSTLFTKLVLVKASGQVVKGTIVITASSGPPGDAAKEVMAKCGKYNEFEAHQYDNPAENYDCWHISFYDPKKMNPSSLAWIQSKGYMLPEKFLTAAFQTLQKSQIIEVTYSFNPDIYFSDHAALQSGNRLPYTDFDILREWAIDWHKLFEEALNGHGTSERFDLPESHGANIFLPPSLNLKEGDSFENSIPIGPMRVPLPAGVWKVVLVSPLSGENGEIGVDRVALAHIVDQHLDGMVLLEQSLYRTTTEGICDHPVSLHRKNEDEFCSAVTGVMVDNHKKLENDYVPAIMATMQAQGISTENHYGGAYFGFTNQLIDLKVFTLFSSSHVGLTDFKSDESAPKAWLMLYPQTMEWLSGWSDAMEAGLTSHLSPGKLPDKWASFDLKSPPPPPDDTKLDINTPITGNITINGIVMPLPQGQWQYLASGPTTDRLGQVGFDTVVLGQTNGANLIRMIQITTNRIGILGHHGVGMQEDCSGTVPVDHHVIKNDLVNGVDCFRTILVPSVQVSSDHPNTYDKAIMNLKTKGVSIPPMVSERFTVSDRDRIAQITYLFSPETIDPASQEAFDTLNSAVGLAHLPPVAGYTAGAVNVWALQWHQLVRDDFDGKFQAVNDSPIRDSLPKIAH